MQRPNEGRPGLTVIVPYRDRVQHLREFVPFMDEFMHGRKIPYRMLIISQIDNLLFNRGMLLNIGFSIAEKTSGWVCFHDIDMLPESEECNYSRPMQPTHLAGCVEQFGFTKPYRNYCGGVILFPLEDFRGVNGFSNEYWGWGREDDDLFLRLLSRGIRILYKAGRYRSLPHVKARRSFVVNNSNRLKSALLSTKAKLGKGSEGLELAHIESMCARFCTTQPPEIPQETDGLSTLSYEVVSRTSLERALLFPIHIGTSHEIVSVSLKNEKSSMTAVES